MSRQPFNTLGADTAPEPPVLRAEELSKAYGPVTVLDGVSLDIRAGEIHAIIGENGAGKSTLMKLLSGHAIPTGGTISLSGKRVAFSSARQAEDAGIVLVHQEILLAPDLTVAQNLFLGRELSRGLAVDDRTMNRRAAEVLARVGSSVRPHARVGDMPLAQQQLFQIARALLDDRKVVIFDEPTAMLANDEVDALLGIVRSLREQGVAVLYISHRLEEVETLADRVTVLRDGKMIGTFPAQDLDQRLMAELMVGRELSMLYPPKRGPSAADPILIVESLSVDHGRVAGSFDVRPGEVLGIGGMIGAGRTELIEGLLGLRPAQAQAISIAGKNVRKPDVGAMMAAGLVYLTENRKEKGLLLNERLGPNLTLQALDLVNPSQRILRRREAQAVERAIQEYDIRVRTLSIEAGQLSGGNQQKLLLAKVMLADPSVVIIDEPTRGIDIGNKSQIYRFIDELVRAGKACVVISSELPELVGLSDRVLVMRAGRFVAELTGTDITEQNIVYAAASSGDDTEGRKSA